MTRLPPFRVAHAASATSSVSASTYQAPPAGSVTRPTLDSSARRICVLRAIRREKVVGSPATVRDKLKHYIKQLGVGNLLGLFQLGSLPADLTRKNMTLFAEQVLPALRAELGL